MSEDSPRYGLKWQLRDRYRTLWFTARHQALRYWGWGLLLTAVISLIVAAVTSDPVAAWAVPVLAVSGGSLLWLHDLRLAVRGRAVINEDEESKS